MPSQQRTLDSLADRWPGRLRPVAGHRRRSCTSGSAGSTAPTRRCTSTRLMNEGKALDWGIVGVGVLPQRPPDARRAERRRTASTRWWSSIPTADAEPRVIGSIAVTCSRRDDPAAVLDRMADREHTHRLADHHRGRVPRQPGRPASSTPSDPRSGADLAAGRRRRHDAVRVHRRGAPARRREAGTPPFTVMSCDNIPGNGDVARKMIVAFARLKDPDLATWIESRCGSPTPWSTGSRR